MVVPAVYYGTAGLLVKGNRSQTSDHLANALIEMGKRSDGGPIVTVRAGQIRLLRPSFMLRRLGRAQVFARYGCIRMRFSRRSTRAPLLGMRRLIGFMGHPNSRPDEMGHQ